MRPTFFAKIQRANASGTGLIYFPESIASQLRIGARVAVRLNGAPSFYAKSIRYSGKAGVYVPKMLMKQTNIVVIGGGWGRTPKT